MVSMVQAIGVIVIVLIVIAAVALSYGNGYSGGSPYGGGTTSAAASTAQTTSVAAATTSVASTTAQPSNSTAKFNVQLSNAQGQFIITPNVITVQSGTTVILNVTNDGTMQHALDVQFVGSAVVTPYLNPGQNYTLKFTAAPAGNYTYWCPVDGHRNLGMTGTLVVTSG